MARALVTLLLVATAFAAVMGAALHRLFRRHDSAGELTADATVSTDDRSTGLSANSESTAQVDVVLVGTFYHEGWLQSHIAPLMAAKSLRRLFVIGARSAGGDRGQFQAAPPHAGWIEVDVSPVVRRLFGRAAARFLALMRLARRERPDFLVGYHIMPNALMCLVVARCFGLKAAYQMTGGPVQIIGGGVGSENPLLRRQRRASRWRERLMRHLVRRFDLVIVRGASAASFVDGIGAGDQCKIIPGSVDLDRFSSRPSETEFDLIAVGRLVAVKRYDRMLEIIAAMKPRRPAVRLAILGDGPLRGPLSDRARQLGIEANVEFLGRRDDVPARLSAARAFLLTSENEGLSIAMMEAMATGLPAIVPRVGDLGELLSDGATGHWIDPTQATSAAVCIESLLADEPRLSRMSAAARSAVGEFASISSVANRWDDCLLPHASTAKRPVSVASPKPRFLRGTTRTAILVFASAFTVRLAFCFGAVPLFGLKTGPTQPDFFTSTDGYLAIAVNMVEHGSFAFAPDAPPTTYRAPAYPIALALVFAATRDIGISVLIVNCLASALTCSVVFLIAVRLFGAKATYLSCAAATFFPLSIYYCASSFSDTFVAMTIALYLLALLLLLESGNARRIGWSGGAFALAALTKAVILPIPLAMCGYAAVRRRQSLRAMMAVCLIGYGCVGLWTLRNNRLTGQFIPVCGGTGYNALVGNYMIDDHSDSDSSLAHGRRAARRHIAANTGRSIETNDLRPFGFLDVPYELDTLYGREAMEMLVKSPALAARKLVTNALRFWYFSSGLTKSIANGVVNGLLLIAAIASFADVRRHRKSDVEVIGLFSVLFVLLYSIIIVHSSRFCLPIVMLLAPAAGVGIARLAGFFRTLVSVVAPAKAQPTGEASNSHARRRAAGSFISATLERPP